MIFQKDSLNEMIFKNLDHSKSSILSIALMNQRKKIEMTSQFPISNKFTKKKEFINFKRNASDFPSSKKI